MEKQFWTSSIPTETREGADREAVQEAVQTLRYASPQEVLYWSVERFGKSMTLACSFGLEDVVLVDMLHQIDPQIDVFYLDTGLLFRETHQTRERLTKRYGKSFIRVSPNLSLNEQEAIHGEALWKRDPHACCAIRKVEPLGRFLSDYRVWCTGIRREQSPTRAHAEMVEWDSLFHMAKLNPLARWTMDDVWDYVRKNGVPFNPMHERWFPSIGCIPCTKQVEPGEDGRAGRWPGLAKTECGLHHRENNTTMGGR
ncbi:phosphoadenylyl-sulfate reductase [Desmospora profundinema]|uniref:Adenosine 5'-phosphosulfate reductase n=1 Tax=Desmospora profundinema TaxID=1571184 RepID=A0ABU1IUG3_9BACL|nr:phosphoadenylyl-sulfate reductase [Desmospora profundinema]MDR6227395.1 phosphoadenosine phosphosulfate reductase [Desmospora profundinema]